MWEGLTQFPGSAGPSSAQAHEPPGEVQGAPGLQQDEPTAQPSVELGQESPAGTTQAVCVLGWVGVLGAQDRNCPWAFECTCEK